MSDLQCLVCYETVEHPERYWYELLSLRGGLFEQSSPGQPTEPLFGRLLVHLTPKLRLRRRLWRLRACRRERERNLV